MRWSVASILVLAVACIILVIVLITSGALTPPLEPPNETPPAPPAEQQWITIDSGLQYKDLAVGDGATAEDGDHVEVLYEGRLTDGTIFDSNDDRENPFDFTIGRREVIAGWDQGIAGMCVGGKRELKIPPDLAYGPNGSPPRIPPNATLEFTVELLVIR